MLYSQHHIEKYLSERFKKDRPGYFIEIGCWDGELISQTAWLEKERGWFGLCVDPFPRNFEGRSCAVVDKAISADGQPREFVKVTTDRRDGGDVSYFSGFRDKIRVHWDLINSHCDYSIIRVDTITIAELFGMYQVPEVIEFLSVDVEGNELEVFQGIDFNRYRFGMIIFEHNDDREIQNNIREILTGAGYLRVETTKLDDIYIFSHKLWLEIEYQKWIDALEVSTVHNFKDNPMVKRMLGEITWTGPVPDVELGLIKLIDNIGRAEPGEISGATLRMVYYAHQVLQKRPRSIVEIGGGAGEFYAVIRALGFSGKYYIFDLPEVKTFQNSYLAEVSKQTGLSFYQNLKYDFCVSFYALGEFDSEVKNWYINKVVLKCIHGLIVWNPHSGAGGEIRFPCKQIAEPYTTHLENKVLSW